MASETSIGGLSTDVLRLKKSSKVVEAEMRNKVEARQLLLVTKVLDRMKAHEAFSVEKDKRAVVNAMEAMKVCYSSRVLVHV